MLRLLLPLLAAGALFAQEPLTTDSLPQPDVPKGKLEHFQWTESEIYPGTERDVWIYVPEQYDASEPAALMVFQDGRGYVSAEQLVADLSLDKHMLQEVLRKKD